MSHDAFYVFEVSGYVWLWCRLRSALQACRCAGRRTPDSTRRSYKPQLCLPALAMLRKRRLRSCCMMPGTFFNAALPAHGGPSPITALRSLFGVANGMPTVALHPGSVAMARSRAAGVAYSVHLLFAEAQGCGSTVPSLLFLACRAVAYRAPCPGHCYTNRHRWGNQQDCSPEDSAGTTSISISNQTNPRAYEVPTTGLLLLCRPRCYDATPPSQPRFQIRTLLRSRVH